jgi:hypothetical protein
MKIKPLFLLCFFTLCNNMFGDNVTFTVYNNGNTNITSFGMNGEADRTTGGNAYNQTVNLTLVSGALAGPGTSATYTTYNSTIEDSACTSPGWNSTLYTAQFRCQGNPTLQQQFVGGGSGYTPICSGTTNLPPYYTINNRSFSVPIGCNTVTCYTNLYWNLKNQDFEPAEYFLVNDYDPQGLTVHHYIQHRHAEPGQTVYFAVTVHCEEATNYHVIWIYQPAWYPTNPASPDGPGQCTSGGIDVGMQGETGGSPFIPDPGPTGNPAPATPPPPNQYNPTNLILSGTNVSILFSSTNIATSVQEGDRALYDAVVKIGSQAHIDAVVAAAEAASISQSNLLASLNGSMGTSNVVARVYNVNLTNGIIEHTDMVNLSNLLAAIKVSVATNSSGSGTNIAVQNWPAGYSNFLAQISTNTQNLIMWSSNDWSNLALVNSNLASKFNQDSNNAGYLSQMATNAFGTNIAREGTLEGLTNLIGSIDATNRVASAQREFDATNPPTESSLWSHLPGFQHDEAGATAAGNAALADSLTAHDAVASRLAGLNDGSRLSGGSPISVDVLAGGSKIFHIAPESSMFAGVFDVMRKLFTWILIAGYYVKVVKTVVLFIRDITKTRGVWVSDISFTAAGFGGNALGVLLFPLMVTALFLVWASTLAVMYSGITGYLVGMSLPSLASANPVASMEVGALHLLLACFPLSLAMGLVCAWITFHFTCGRILLIVNGIVRFLPGA